VKLPCRPPPISEIKDPQLLYFSARGRFSSLVPHAYFGVEGKPPVGCHHVGLAHNEKSPPTALEGISTFTLSCPILELPRAGIDAASSALMRKQTLSTWGRGRRFLSFLIYDTSGFGRMAAASSPTPTYQCPSAAPSRDPQNVRPSSFPFLQVPTTIGFRDPMSFVYTHGFHCTTRIIEKRDFYGHDGLPTPSTPFYRYPL